jgi:hypothetical protein
MAQKITAIRRYRPEIERKSTRQTAEIIEEMCRSTTLSRGVIRNVVDQLQETLMASFHDGRAAKIEGLGTFTPTIRMDGSLDVLFRPEPDMLRQLNDKTRFKAKILNRSSIGQSADDLIARWNAEHPEDLVEE